MIKFRTFIILMLIGVLAKSNNTDSLFKYLNRYAIPKQLQIIDSLSFSFVVENNQKIIPTLLQYEELAKKQSEFKILAKVYVNISLAYYYCGKYDENLKYGLKALHLYDSLKCLSELGTMYGELGYQMKYRNLSKATYFMYNGMRILEELGSNEPLAKIYDNYGVLKEINNQVDSAIYYYQNALELKISMNDSLGIPFSLNNLFMANMLMNRPATGLNYLDESTKIRTKRKDSIGLAENFGYYGQYYSTIGDYQKAIEYNNKSLDIAQKRNYINLVKSAYLDLSYNYEQLENFRQSLKYHKLFSTMQDSLINLETNKTIADLQVQYETAEKEKQLIKKSNQLEQQKTTKIAVIIVAFILISSTIFYFRNKILTAQRNEKIKVQNALIEGEQAERNRLALELHDGVASDLNGVILLLRNSTNLPENEKNSNLDKSLQHLNQTHQMVRKLSHSLMPRSLKEKGLQVALLELVNNFKSEERNIDLQILGVEDRLSQFVEFNVFRIIQEALSNIIKHSSAKSILIECSKVDSRLFVAIEDDGVGFDISEVANKSGIGLQNISNRAKMMNGRINISSSKGEGTTIEIEILLNDTL